MQCEWLQLERGGIEGRRELEDASALGDVVENLCIISHSDSLFRCNQEYSSLILIGAR